MATVVCVALIAVAPLLSFAPALENEFVYWDDENNLMFNTHIRSFSGENLKWMWTTTLLGVWQPLTWVLTAVQYELFAGADSTGPDFVKFSRGMHLTSIGLHAVAALLAFFVIRRLVALGAPQTAAHSPGGLNLGALFGGLLFAVHPLRVETTAWGSGQAYILAILPALGAVWCYLKAHQTGRWRWHVFAVVCLTASLLCKAMSVPLVAVLLVLDFYPLQRVGGAAGWNVRVVGRVLLEKIPYIAMTALTAFMTVWATATTKEYSPEPAYTKLLITGFCLLFYVSMTFVPWRPAPYYMKPTPFDNSDPWFVGAAAGCVLITLGLVFFRRRLPWLLAVWVGYALILLPNTGLIKHGGQLAADRYSYLSCLGWAALVGAAAFRIWAGGPSFRRCATSGVASRCAGSAPGARRGEAGAWESRTEEHGPGTILAAGSRTVPPAPGPPSPVTYFFGNLRRAALVVAGVAMAVGLGLMSRSYCRDWKDSETVWSAMVERNPRFWMGYYNLAKANKRLCPDLLKQAEEIERQGDTQQAAQLRSEATERFRLAEANYRKAIDLYPVYPEANVDLGNMIRQGQASGGMEAAIQCYETALRGRPGFHMAHFNLGWVMMGQKKYDEAVTHFELAEKDAERAREGNRVRDIREALNQARARLVKSKPPS